jgi:hypothetical protein
MTIPTLDQHPAKEDAPHTYFIIEDGREITVTQHGWLRERICPQHGHGQYSFRDNPTYWRGCDGCHRDFEDYAWMVRTNR